MVNLLSDAQREELPLVILRRERFKQLVAKAILNRGTTFSNGIILSGKPGSGKTTIVTEFLEDLVTDGKLDEYKSVSGHMTKVSLFNFLKPEEGKSFVHLLDDVDCIYDEGCLEILKSALDTKSSSQRNRWVYYNSGYITDQYKYTDFCILITNDQFTHISTHMQAVLDRVHLFKIDMKYEDFIIFNSHLLEKYLNDNEDGLPQNIIDQVVEFYKTDILRWFDCNAFTAANINFSIRLIRKFIDLIIMFGEDWKTYSIDYEKLNKACSQEKTV